MSIKLKMPEYLTCLLLSVSFLMAAHLTLADSNAPLVKILSQNESVPEISRSEVEILTGRMMADLSAEHADESARIQLSQEIERALSFVRRQCPEIAEVTAVDYYAPGLITLEFDSQFTDVVADLVNENTGMIHLSTGNKRFDELNVQMGLHAVRHLSLFNNFFFYVDRDIHPIIAARRYLEVEEVVLAEANAYLGDSSDLRLTKSNGTWYMFVRKAWGDCPSGCINQAVSYFTFDGNNVTLVPEDVALKSGQFAKLAGY